MKKFFPLFLGIFAAFSINTFAQGPSETATRLTNLEAELGRYMFADDDEVPAKDGDRPRIVAKASGVAASVIEKTSLLSRAAFKLINQKRVDSGLEPLAWSEQLATVARLHSQNMADFKFFDHKGLDNKYVSDRADDAGVGKWRSIGENIAFNRGYADPVAKAVELWLDSPSHRHNMMDPNWKEAAIGVAIADDGSYYFTQVFLRR
ncbi:MAG: CAP domain-containing protein [Acidobacteria bacterium]|nr:CAP domain-containing protein [Acidobacteriota bacterium]